jgi:hypothetical protein
MKSALRTEETELKGQGHLKSPQTPQNHRLASKRRDRRGGGHESFIERL